ncbi:hypothetical protein CDD83_6399 [Cordyceps sp. RAO-2017]|nr:hypothetical protein CDD83_6399 [Cordyceps sp. RAO-2017]
MRDFDSAEALVELYSELFPRYKQRPFPPLLTASLMQAYLNDGRWERVMQLWERLWEEALATLRPPGQGAVAYPGYRHYMSKPFPYLAKALQAAGRGADLARWVDRLVGAGFTLTRDGWNGVIQALVVAGKWERGMSWCENKLMAGWRGWRPAPARLEEKRELKNPRVLMPNKQTMQDLLRQWLQMRKLAAWSA